MICFGFGSRRGFARGVLAGASLLGLSSLAGAQDQQAENVAAARSLGIQGVQLADAGKCPEAIEKLSRAESLYHAPTILGRLGECQVVVGQIVLGTENLNRVVREQLPPNAPKAFKAAQERAAKVLETALPRIARLTVNVEPLDAKPSVTVAGTPVPSALIGVERPTDPGKHVVVATAGGYLEARTEVELSEGAHQAVTLKLVPDPSVAVVAPPPPVVSPAPVNTAPAPADSAPQEGGGKTLAFVMLGVGGVGLVTGGVTGFLAIQKKSDLDCPDKTCTGSQADELDSANTLALVSTIGFGVGAAAAVVGVVLLATSGSSAEKPATASVAGVRVTPYLGLRSAGVTGAF
ncbi:MAG TPA: hypothetical protein VFZ53_13775 [Polyangiaceae bacterium]